MKLILSLLVLAGLTSCSSEREVFTVKPTRQKVETVVTTTSTGTIEAEDDAVLGFGIAGRISKIYFHLGEKVEKGQLIAELENQDMRSGFETAQSEAQRNEKLFQSKLISKSALEESRRALEVARTSFDRTRIVAPFSGVISEHNLGIGELFQLQDTSGKAAVRLIDMKPRRVKGRIDEVDLAKVKVSAKARVRIQAVRAEPFDATVIRLVPFISTTKDQDRTAEVYLQIQNSGAEVPVGASADVEIVINEKEGALSLPSRALLGVGQLRYVWKLDGSKLKKQSVKLGIGNYDRSEIIEGLTENDVVALPSEALEFTEGFKARGVEQKAESK